MTMEEGALMESLSWRRAKLRLGSHVLILGAAPIGLVTLIVAKASSTTIVYLNEHRLKTALDLGFTNADKICKGTDVEAAVSEICKTIGENPERTIGCMGSEESARLGIYVIFDREVREERVILQVWKTAKQHPEANVFKSIGLIE
ncbi:unnamed protein product [Ceratitis capitata]|uniref:(Mediterranean fruit fly) hypothetical protein n=1 Tax=Ceratitis capitata TaxID=7213 RepID=A0A811UEZ6_CERCA|nr:unnamed protein product [Ceratitis capitata]